MHPYALAKHAYVHPTTLFPRGILAGPFGPVFEGPLSPMAASREQGNRRQVDSEEFARILTKQAAAHVCVALGFSATTAGALECLTDVVQRYVEDMAKRTMENTYRAGRTEANVADVLQGLQQMPIPLSWTELRDFAFSEDGYSATNRSAVGGATSSASNNPGVGAGGAAAGGGGEERPKRWDQPFHHSVPAFPLPRKRPAPWGGRAAGGGEEDVGEGGGQGGPGFRPPHIPAFMPPLPPSTSRETCAGSGRNLAEIRLERLKRQRQGETALRSLGAPVAGGASSTASSTASPTVSSTSKSRGGANSSVAPSGNGKLSIGKKRASTGGGGNGKAQAGGATTGANGSAGVRPPAGSGSGTGGGVIPKLALRLGNGVLGRARQGGTQTGFRAIPPNATGASARASAGGTSGMGSGTASSAGGSSGLGKIRLGKVLSGGGRGAFGRSNDATREDRILEGMPPDGTGDVDGTA